MLVQPKTDTCGEAPNVRFLVTIDRDEDGAWVVECPSIPGCVSQGATKDEALENIQDAIRACLEVRRRKGNAPDGRNAPGRGDRLMAELPLLSGPEVVKVFESFGWAQARQRGSHMILVLEGHPATLSVPDHKEVARGTLRSLIRSAGLTVEEFVAAMR